MLSAIVGALALAASPLLAQNGTIAGRVTDAATGAPVASVQVQVAGINIGGSSTADGTYRIVNVPAGSYTVIMRRIGYKERRTPNVVVFRPFRHGGG